MHCDDFAALLNGDSLKMDSRNLLGIVFCEGFISRRNYFMLIVCRIIGFKPSAFFFNLVPDRTAIIQRILLSMTKKIRDDTAEDSFVKILGMGI